MTETAKNESEETTSKREALSAQSAVSSVSYLAQLAIGSFATFSGLLYGMGYLLTLGQMRMLGVGTIDVSNQEIVRKVISIPLLSVVCAVFSLCTVEGLLVAVGLLLVCLNAERLGLYRQQHVKYQKLRSLLLRWGGPLAALVIVSLYSSLYLSGQILTQRDLLLRGGSVAISDTDQLSHSWFLLSQFPIDDLVKLKASEFQGRQVYGFQVLAIAFCLTVVVGLWITLQNANELSNLRQKAARLTLAIASLLVLLQFLNIPFLYGYLVMDTKFPCIETASFPTEKVSKHCPMVESNRLLLLGSSKDKYIVYSMEHRQVWRGVKDEDLLPAKQLPELDPFLFGNPFPSPERIKSVYGGLVVDAEEETPYVQIPPSQWIDLLAILLPANQDDELANTFEEDATYYSAEWDELGSAVITTRKDEKLQLTLFEVHERRGDKPDHFIAFKLSTEQAKDSSRQSEADADETESDDEKPTFIGRTYLRSGQERKLTRGHYYSCRDPYRFKQFFAPTPNENAEKPDDKANEPVAEAEQPVATVARPAEETEKPAAPEVEKPAVEVEKPAAPEVEKPAVEVEKPAAEVEKSATEAEKPAAEVEKPAAEAEKPAAEVEKPAAEVEKPAAEDEKPAAVAEKPAGAQNSQEPTKAPDNAERKQLNNIRLKTK